LDSFAIGTMIGVGTFLNLSDPADILFTEPSLHLNISRRQLEIHFSCAFDDLKPDIFKLILPLRFLTPNSFIVNEGLPSSKQHTVVFETSVAAQLWKLSDELDEDDLKDRLFWSEHEQWMRQCDIRATGAGLGLSKTSTSIIPEKWLLPLGSLGSSQANPTIGRWKAFCLLLPAETKEDATQIDELLRSLQALNLKISDRAITLTLDTGHAVGPGIASSLEGLPYKVRYAFDVCVSHGYL
jgi:hypothetical protein